MKRRVPARWRLWWKALSRRERFDADLAAELEFHRQARADDLVARGMTPDDAQRQARIELGQQGLHRDDCRRARGLGAIDAIGADLRYALRGLRRNPGYSATALSVLGLAIAANALLFALFNAYALRNPPIERAERWVAVDARNLQQRVLDRWSEADADTLLRNPPAMFEGLYGVRTMRLPVVAEVTRTVGGEAVTDNYFDLLGVRAARGRVFSREAPRADMPAVVLSDLGWQRLLGGDPEPLGRTIQIAGRDFAVVGVTPPGFSGLSVSSALFWIRDVDYRMRPQPEASGAWRMEFDVGGFLREGESAAAAVEALTPRVLANNPDKDEMLQLSALRVEPRRGYLRADERDEMVMLGIPVAIAFVLLLLVASANLGNLVLARFAARQRELAVRVAVGAPRVRLVTQLLSECVLLALIAAVIGYGLAALLLEPVHAALFSLMGELGYDVIAVEVEARVFGYGLGVALLAALCFGGVPALIATAPWRRGFGGAPDPAALQRAGASRLRSALMVGQLAASVVLLVLASLAAVNARHAESIALGFDPTRLVAVTGGSVDAALLDAFADLPAIAAAGATSHTPLMQPGLRIDVNVGAASQPLAARRVGAGYLETMETTVLHGRGLRAADGGEARVVVISKRTAERLFPDTSSLGRMLEVPPQDASLVEAGRYEVVGVVADVVSGWYVAGPDASALYFPARIGDEVMDTALLRLRDTSPASLEAIRKECARVRADIGCELMPLASAFRFQRLPFVIASNVAGALGWISLGMSCLGLYGLVSYLMLQKRREIGVRLALGASSARVTREMLGQALRQVVLGLALGLPIAFGAAQLARSVSTNLSLFDPLSFGAVPLALAALALAAAWVPARRTAAVAPTEALRQE